MLHWSFPGIAAKCVGLTSLATTLCTKMIPHRLAVVLVQLLAFVLNGNNPSNQPTHKFVRHDPVLIQHPASAYVIILLWLVQYT